jgi:hypothetical protein
VNAEAEAKVGWVVVEVSEITRARNSASFGDPWIMVLTSPSEHVTVKLW